MASKTVDMGELAVLVRSIIMAEKGGMEKSKFLTQYKSQEGTDFPFKVSAITMASGRWLRGIFVSGRMNSAADYVSTPCGVVRRRRCRGWREGSN